MTFYNKNSQFTRTSEFSHQSFTLSHFSELQKNSKYARHISFQACDSSLPQQLQHNKSIYVDRGNAAETVLCPHGKD